MTRGLGALLSLSLALVACAEETPPTNGDGCPLCVSLDLSGRVQTAALGEISGMVGSAYDPRRLWVHNDSGDAPRLYALRPDGQILASLAVDGAQAEDWEDLAAGPCPAGTCLYVGDIGDNDAERDEVRLYRLREPESLEGLSSVPAERLKVRYPDGPHDAEVLLVDPADGGVLIVTKAPRGERGQIFSVAGTIPFAGTTVAQDEGLLAAAWGDQPMTAGDVAPERSGLLLRSRDEVLYLALAPGQPLAEALRSGAACSLPAGDEAQGEALAFRRDAPGYLTADEGANAAIHEGTCQAW